MILPQAHPQRFELNDEVHARPTEAMGAPLGLSYLALLSDTRPREQAWQQACDLAARFARPPPRAGATHYRADCGPFRMKWEQHTEFVRHSFIVPGADARDPFASPAIASIPADWLADLQGQVIVGAHVGLISAIEEPLGVEILSARHFGGNVLVGATVAGEAAVALTDFRIHADGFSRFLVLDRSTTLQQAGRLVQRLLEIDTYRMLALLALPVAQALNPFLTHCERELAEITATLANAGEADEARLLDRLTRVAAEIESRQANNLFRFSAGIAYYDLVHQRIVDLREGRIRGLQTFREFTDRRLAPAMNTLRSAAERQESLSQRVARATQLLSTRVDLTRERQNQALLASVDRRARLQLRLQETVEGLSVAALTYYIVGLVGYAAKGLNAGGLPVNVEMAMATSLPVVVVLVALGVRRVRRSVKRDA